MTLRAEAENLDLSLDDWRRIDSLCDRYEAACLAGKRPEPNTFLADLADADGSVCDHLACELLSLDLESFRRRGEKPDVAVCRERSREHRESVEEAFAALDLAKRTLAS